MGSSGSRGIIGKSASTVPTPTTNRVFFDITTDGDVVGRMEFMLYEKECPKTCENFRALCTGDNQAGYSYKGSIFHRIINGFMAQGGDFTNHNGTGGVSIYGKKFPDENLTLLHNKRGILSMANAGPNTNGSQFFILLAPAPWLDGKHVVFGEMTEGEETLQVLERAGSQSGSPMYTFKIANCGELKKDDIE